jgi:hypothetical protein
VVCIPGIVLDAILLAILVARNRVAPPADGSVPNSSQKLGLEPIAHSRLGDEVAWASGVIFELVSECLDVVT